MTKIDKNNFPRLEPDLNLGVIISPVKSGTGRGNSAHDSGTGRFTFLPKGVNILEGSNLAKGLSTATAKLFREKAAAVGANQASLRIINGKLHVVLLVDGKRLGSFAVEPIDVRKGKAKEGGPVAELSDSEKDYIIKFARDLGLSGEKLKTRLSEVFKGISPPQIQELEHMIDAQRINDIVAYLDFRLRKEIREESISDSEVRIAVGRGFLRKSFAILNEDQTKIILQRLQGIGWTTQELQRGMTGKLPKRLKPIVESLGQQDSLKEKAAQKQG